FPSCVRFRWTGAQYAPAMFTMKGGSAFKCRHIDFDANNLALSTWWLPSANTWSTQACRWEYCGFVSCLSAPYWLPGHAYSSTSNGGFGDVVVGPDPSDILSNQGLPSNSGYLYHCTTAGTSHATGAAAGWLTTLNVGGTVNDGTCVWTQIGRAPTQFLVGTEIGL